MDYLDIDPTEINICGLADCPKFIELIKDLVSRRIPLTIHYLHSESGKSFLKESLVKCGITTRLLDEHFPVVFLADNTHLFNPDVPNILKKL